MALQLMKLLVTATTTVATVPTQEKFFYVTTVDTAAGTTLTIDPTDFFDNTGDEVTTLPALAPNNSMYSVYINGVLQMQGTTTYTDGGTGEGSLEIRVPPAPDGDTIWTGTPIVLEVINFVPTSATTVNT